MDNKEAGEASQGSDAHKSELYLCRMLHWARKHSSTTIANAATQTQVTGKGVGSFTGRRKEAEKSGYIHLLRLAALHCALAK